MNKSHFMILLTLLFVLPAVGLHAESPIGEFEIGVGGVYPQGDYARYTDPGFTVSGRLVFHVPNVSAFSGWCGGTFSQFKHEETNIDIEAGSFLLDGIQSIDESAFALHLGLQLGSGSRRGFLRPHAGLAGGLYVYNTKVSVRERDADEDLASDNDARARFGWRGRVGTDLFFVTKWAVSLTFIYDHVVNLDHSDFYSKSGGLREEGRAAQYHTYMIGVVVPFETIDDD